MDSVNLSPANKAYIQQNHQQVATNPQTQIPPEQKKDGKKLLIAGAAAVATIAVAGIMIYKGKAPKKLADIQFDGGKAKKGEKLFTGAIEDTLKNGNKIKLEYKDGVIQKAITETDGKKVVKEYVDGVISKKDGKTIDIKKVQEEVKLNQDKLKKLLKDDTLSSEELSKQADKIKYKSKNQQKEIEKIVDSKAQKEAQLAKEAQEKALKAQKEAQEKAVKEAQERAAKEAQERLAQQEAIERAQKDQDEHIKAMQTPSKSAKESYQAIKELKRAEEIADEGNFEQRLEFIKTNDYNLFLEHKPLTMKFLREELPSEYIEAMSDDVLASLLNLANDEIIVENFKELITNKEIGMTPEKFKKVNKYAKLDLKGFLTKQYNNLKEYNEFLDNIKCAANRK